MTLKDWLDNWLMVYVSPSVRLHTVQMYRRAAAAVPDKLAACELDELRIIDIAYWLRSVQRDHPRAAQLDRIMITRALRQAYACREMTWKIEEDALPKISHRAKETATLSADQLRTYMTQGAAAAGACWPALLLCCCGLRRGEALGVRRRDISPEGVLHIQRQRYPGPGGKLITAPLKTRAADRMIKLPSIVLDAINAAPVLIGGYLVDISPRSLYNRHRAVLRSLGLPEVTLHGLRHSMATISAADGVPPSVLMQSLGHGDVEITLGLYANHLQSTIMPLDVRLYGA